LQTGSTYLNKKVKSFTVKYKLKSFLA